MTKICIHYNVTVTTYSKGNSRSNGLVVLIYANSSTRDEDSR